MIMSILGRFGEHAGSGVPNIFNVWEDEGWEEPIIEESFDPDRTTLILKFVKKQANKMSDKEKLFYISLLKIFDDEAFVTVKMISDITKIPSSTVRRYLNKLRKMNVIKADGKNKGTKYYLKSD